MRQTSLNILVRLHPGRFLLLAAALALYPTLTASAHQSPVGCNSNRFNISIIKDRTEVYQGQVLTYTVTATNVNFGNDIACDITAAAISVTLPAPDGTPTGQVVTLAGSQNFPAGSTTSIIGSASYTVNVNSGVSDIVAQARAEGTLHDAPVDHSALIIKTLGTTVVAPPSEPPDPDGGSGGEPSTGQPDNPPASVRPAILVPKLPNTGLRDMDEDR